MPLFKQKVLMYLCFDYAICFEVMTRFLAKIVYTIYVIFILILNIP